MAADVVDEAGNPVRGAVGELVVRQPWIGMTRGFWKDPERYLETYWSRIPDVWVHGDFAAIDEDDLWYILGRSDDTIKVAGKRLGPAEVETVLVAHPAVIEAAAIGVPDELKGQAVVAFVVLQPDYEPSDAVRAELKATRSKRAGETTGAQSDPLCGRHSQDAQCKGNAPRYPGRLSAPATRRSDRSRQSGSGRRYPASAVSKVLGDPGLKR